MNNIDPIPITQDPNMTDDVIRFYEAQISQDEEDGIRSPFLSTFDVNRSIPAGTLASSLPSYTPLIDSYISLDMEPERSTQRTTSLINDGFETRKGHRAIKSGRHIVEFSGNCYGNLNGTYGLRLGIYGAGIGGTRVITCPRVITNAGSFTITDETNYRVPVYLKSGEYFLFQLYVNGSNSGANITRSASIIGKVKVFCIENRFITGQTFNQ